MAYDEENYSTLEIPDELTAYPEALPAYYGQNVPDWQNRPNMAPLPGGTMTVPGPRIYATPTSNAYIAEQQALRGLDLTPHQQLEQYKMGVQAEEDAVRFSGQQEYQNLVSAGATPEEALRRTAGKLFYNHPERLAMALNRVPQAGDIPSSVSAVPIMGASGPVGNAVYDARGRLHSAWQSPVIKMPPDVAAQQKITQAELGTVRKNYERATKEAETARATGDEQASQEAARRALAYRNQLEGLGQNLIQGSTNWMAPQSITPPDGTVIKYDKSGKGWIVDPSTKKVLGPA